MTMVTSTLKEAMTPANDDEIERKRKRERESARAPSNKIIRVASERSEFIMSSRSYRPLLCTRTNLERGRDRNFLPLTLFSPGRRRGGGRGGEEQVPRRSRLRENSTASYRASRGRRRGASVNTVSSSLPPPPALPPTASS